MSYVVVVIAPDGTVAVVGTPSKKPFATMARAQTTAKLWDVDGRQVEVCSIDSGEM